VCCFLIGLLSCVQDYLKELDSPFKDVYNKSTLDRAFTVTYNNTRCCSSPDWLTLEAIQGPFICMFCMPWHRFAPPRGLLITRDQRAAHP
jgi:hypothetical protein